MEQKILAHMNQNHKLALEDYLAVYGDVKITDKISNIKLKSIDKSNLVLSFNHKDVDFEIEKIVVLDPPMANVATDARPRLVAMAKEAAEKRGYSHVQIKNVVYPHRVPEYLLLASLYVLIFAYFKPEYFYGTIIGHYLGVSSANPVVSSLRIYTPTILYSTIVVHFAEIALVLYPLLNKYRVPVDIRVEWVISALFEGFFAIKRFKSLIPHKH